ncbi:MAG: helix-turn-helix transcriptional regulator [Patescibacteria group bacterium]|nr:helix-turn-helix transcriptional regulator [Patescibacteria group bacterium]
MTAESYKRERQARGSQTEVAAKLDVRQATISQRETGRTPVNREAWLALLSLPKLKPK